MEQVHRRLVLTVSFYYLGVSVKNDFFDVASRNYKDSLKRVVPTLIEFHNILWKCATYLQIERDVLQGAEKAVKAETVTVALDTLCTSMQAGANTFEETFGRAMTVIILFALNHRSFIILIFLFYLVRRNARTLWLKRSLQKLQRYLKMRLSQNNYFSFSK